MGHARGIALEVRLDDTRLTVGDGKEPSVVLLSPGNTVTVLDGAVEIQQRDIHDQILSICQRDVVLKDVKPQRIVWCKQACVEIRRVGSLEPFMLQEWHLAASHHDGRLIVEMGDKVLGPVADVNPHTFESVEAQPCFHDGVHQIGVERIELTGLQVADGDGVSLRRLVVHLHILQVIAAGHQTTAVEHHRSCTACAVAMSSERESLGQFLAHVVGPHLDFNLLVATWRGYVDEVAGGEHLRGIQLRIVGAHDVGDAHMEQPLPLAPVHTKGDVLVVARIKELLVETHRVLGSIVAYQVDETLHFFSIVDDAMVDGFPLELTIVAPGIQLRQVRGILHREVGIQQCQLLANLFQAFLGRCQCYCQKGYYQ